MKQIFFLILFAGSSLTVFAQTQMFIHKIDGTTDSLLLSQIKDISFKSTIPLPSDSSLVLYYPFNGNANDESGHGYNGIVDGAILTMDRFGNDSSAYSFNGINSIIRSGDILDSVFCAPVAKFTIAGWAKPNNLNGPIISKSAGGTGPYQWNMTTSSGLALAEVYSDTVATNYTYIAQTVLANQWIYFCLVFDGEASQNARVKLYINGEDNASSINKQSGQLGTSTQNSFHQVTIGGVYDPQNPNSIIYSFKGSIDEIRIYNKALSKSEIQALYFDQH